MPTLAVEDEQRMVHMLTVIAVVEGAFLLSVGGICGRVEVKQHLLGSAVPLSLSQVDLEEDFGCSVAGAYRGRVLHPRDGRLTGKVEAALGKRAAAEFEQRIFSKSVRVVLIVVSARYLKNALPNERGERVARFPRAPLGHTFGDGLAQAQLLVHPRQPEHSSIGGEPATVEGGFQSKGALRLKTHRLCGTIINEGASFGCRRVLDNPTIARKALSLQLPS